MREQEWWTDTDPKAMLAFLEGRASLRKLRLFALASCRRALGFLGYFDMPSSLRILTCTEYYVDGLMNWEELWATTINALNPAWISGSELILPMPFWAKLPGIIHRGQFDVFVKLANELGDRIAEGINDTHAALKAPGWEEREAAHAAWQLALYGKRLEQLLQCFTLRDLFGNPFRPVAVASFPPDSNVLLLARRLYEIRGFHQLPELADALEDAGCDDADILNHCRQSGEHVRGCWVIDLLLGKM